MIDAFKQGRPTYAEISLSNLAFNFRSIRSFVDNSEILSVVKADSYGHGATEVARTLEEMGCRWFGVALPEEGVDLRRAGISGRILSLGGFWGGQENLVVEANITPVIFDLEQASAIDRAARAKGRTTAVHVKIDTGMGRLGVPFDAIPEFSARLREYSNLRVEGVMSHFSSADDPGSDDFTAMQIARFNSAVGSLRSAGLSPEFLDIANSPGAVLHKESRLGLVRIGGILYGLGDDILPVGCERPELRPVMSLVSRISLLKSVPAGTPLGYNRTFITSRNSRIASVPIGYHDGIPRSLSNRFHVLVRGRRAPIVGRISMDWTLVDVTDVEGAGEGDRVVLIGRDADESISAAQMASVASTLSYEITCGVGARVPRVFVRE